MKSCPECKRTFEDTFTFCLVDGSILSAPFDPSATLTLPPPTTESLPVESSKPEWKPPPPPTIATQRPVPPATLVSENMAAPFAPVSRETATDFDAAKRKPNYMVWIAVGLGLIVIAAIGLSFLLLKKASNTRWEDTEANRQADRKAGVAARVNGKPIMQADVDKSVSQQAGDSLTKLSALELQQARLQVLDNLIQREALVQRADREKLQPTEEQVTAIIEKQKKDSGMTEEQFQSELKNQNMTLDALREQARRDLAIQALQDKHTAAVSVTDKEIEDYYNSNRTQFVNERGAGLSMIVADPADNSSQGFKDDAKTETDAKVKIDNIANDLRNGADFATTARAKSEDAGSLTKGGDIGYFSEAKLRETGFPQDLIAKFMGPMAVGDTTGPRLINGKWYIFKLTQRRLTNENLTLDSPGVRAQIKEALTDQRKQILNSQLLTSTLNETKVVNYLAAG
jgi:foldase protein PrsA